MKRPPKKPSPKPPAVKQRLITFTEGRYFAPFLIGLAALVCDFQSWGHQFVFDDAPYIVQNQFIQDPRNILLFFVSRLVPPPATIGSMYRPMTSLGLGLNYWISGPNPDAFHIVNRILHLVICLLVYRIARRLVPNPRFMALFTALLFAVHPFQTEAVTYITGRSDTLAALFFLLGWLCFLRLRAAEQFSMREYAPSCLFYLLALFSKEDGITWLGVLLLTELIYLSKVNLRRFFKQIWMGWRIYAGYVVVTIFYLGLRREVMGVLTARKPEFAVNPLAFAPLTTRLLTSLKVWFLGIGQFFWPRSFSTDYSYNQIPMISRWTEPAAWITIILSLLFFGLFLWGVQRARHMAFGLGFFAATYSVVSNLFLSIGTIRGDRLFYLPSIGLCWCVGAGAAWLYERYQLPGPRWVFRAVMVAVLVLLAGRTIVRNRDWRTQTALIESDFRVCPRSVKVLSNFGSLYFNRHEFDQALVYYRQAESIDSNYTELLNNIGSLFLQEKKFPEALQYYRRVTELEPKKTGYRINYALALTLDGDFSDALAQYTIALQKDPQNAAAHYGRATALYSLGRVNEAIEEFRKTVEIDPLYPSAQENLNILLQRTGHSP